MGMLIVLVLVLVQRSAINPSLALSVASKLVLGMLFGLPGAVFGAPLLLVPARRL